MAELGWGSRQPGFRVYVLHLTLYHNYFKNSVINKVFHESPKLFLKGHSFLLALSLTPHTQSFLPRPAPSTRQTPHARMSPVAPESIIKFYLLAAFLTGISHHGILMNQTLLCVTFVRSIQTTSKPAPPVSPPSTQMCIPWSHLSIFELLLKALPMSPNN